MFLCKSAYSHVHGVHTEVRLHQKCSKEKAANYELKQAVVYYMVQASHFEYFLTFRLTFFTLL